MEVRVLSGRPIIALLAQPERAATSYVAGRKFKSYTGRQPKTELPELRFLCLMLKRGLETS